MRHRHGFLPRSRAEIANFAAKLLVDGAAPDFETARRKAARDLGYGNSRDLPDNWEIHCALAEHLSLFGGDKHRRHIARLRQAALKAMAVFTDFAPRLVGPVLYGTACAHDDIALHLHSNEVEAVTRFLLERRVRYELTEIQSRVSGNAELVRLLAFKIEMFGELFTLVVLPAHGVRVLLSALDGKPMRRLAADGLRTLIESRQTIPAHAAPSFVDASGKGAASEP